LSVRILRGILGSEGLLGPADWRSVVSFPADRVDKLIVVVDVIVVVALPEWSWAIRSGSVRRRWGRGAGKDKGWRRMVVLDVAVMEVVNRRWRTVMALASESTNQALELVD
jgi:hypothetical protein